MFWFHFQTVYFQVSLDSLPAFQHVCKVIEQLAMAQDRLAQKWLEIFPQKAYDLVRGNRLPAGARLVSTTSDVATPTCKDMLFWGGEGAYLYWYLLSFEQVT